MTCIVGIVDQENVYIGGDSAGVGGLDITVRKDPKVFKNGEFVIGCCGSFRMMNILRFSFNAPSLTEGEDIYKYMCTSFINEIRRVFKDGGFSTNDKGEEKGGLFLIGFRGHLFRIDYDFQVGESVENYESIGCGDSYALGSLETRQNGTAESRIEIALTVACKFSGGVRPPFTIVSTK